MSKNIIKALTYKNQSAEQLKCINKYLNRVSNAELHIERDNSVRNLQFINIMDITKLTLTFCENIDFSTLPDKVQQIHIIGPSDFKGLEKTQVKYLIHQQELKKEKSNQLVFSDDSNSLDEAFFFSEDNNLLTIQQQNQQRTLSQYEERLNIIRFKLGKIQTLEYLQLNYNAQIELDKFSQLQQLKYLDLRDNKQIIGSTNINLPFLTHINLSGSNITDISYLEQIQNLICIDISQNSIYSLDPLQHLKFIEHLNASENKILELPTLKCENTLKYLDLCKNKNINIVNIQNLNQLEELYLKNTNVAELSILKNLIKLCTLDIGNNMVTDLFNVQFMLNIQTLIAGYNQIQQISELSECKQLKTLLLYHNKIKSIFKVTNLKLLEEIDITNNLVENISAIKYLPNLHIFNGGHNQVKDVSFLSECHNLQEINLEYNLIQRLGRVNPSLTKLQLNDNQILDVDEFLAQSNQFQILQLDNNYIYNLEALHNMNLNFRQNEICIQYLRRNVSNDITEVQTKQFIQGFIRDINKYKNDLLNNYDSYYTQKYQDQLQMKLDSYKILNTNKFELIKYNRSQQEYEQKKQKQRKTESVVRQIVSYKFCLLISNEENLRDVYFVQNLQPCEVLTIDTCPLLNFSRAPLNVTNLQIKDCELKSIEGIQQMTNLVSLNVSNNLLVDISQLHFLVNLKYFDVSQNQIIYLYPLRNFKLIDVDISINFIPKEQIVHAQHHTFVFDRDQLQLNANQMLYYKKLLAVDEIQGNVLKNKMRKFSTIKTKVNQMLFQNLTQLSFVATQTVRLIQSLRGQFE
ncbi:Conserved_hypothetical protein [Hexamita inflata]|uniref:Uncharacterized protein n=1 Tax=Hexamita inflata TaxID=28002 RepID=A0AA86TN95_9EUKA|nr:Conserved hypothetical protein [Hexamita inflata]